MRVSSRGVVQHLKSVRDNEALRKAVEQVQPEVVTFSLAVAQSDKIFKAWQEISKSKEWASLSEAHQTIVKNEMRDAELSGGMYTCVHVSCVYTHTHTWVYAH
jgi:Zn-dependent oligopeptidase